MKKTITFFPTRAAMMLLTTLLLTLTAQTAWAQDDDPFQTYSGDGDLTINTPGPYIANGIIYGDLIIETNDEENGVFLNVGELTVHGDIILSSGTLMLSVSDEKRIEAQTINATHLYMDGGRIDAQSIDATDLTMTDGSITCSGDITFESGEISNGRIDAHTINATNLLTMTGGTIGPETTINASTLDMSDGIVNAVEINARGGTISGGRITATGQFVAGDAGESNLLTISGGTIDSEFFRICNLEIDALTGAPSITATTYYINGDLSITGFVTDGTNVYDGNDDESVKSLKEYLQANGGTPLTKAEVYSVVFNANAEDYEGTMSEQIFMVGERKALSECNFTREGYMFDGWAESLDGSVKYADEEEVEDLATSGETKILYAHWTQGRIFKTGTYDVDADTDIPGTIIVVGDVTLNVSAALTFGEIRPEGGCSLTLNVLEGGFITSTGGILADEFNMTGGTVNSFSLSADAGEISGGTLDITNVFITHDNIISGGNITVRNYLQINGDLQFKAEHANMSIYAKEYDFNIGSLTIIGSRGFSDGMTVYNPGTIANNNISSLNEKTLKPAYTVSYDANGGTGDVASQTKCSGIDIPLASAGFTRTGYTLDGWATSANGAKVYELGGTYSANADLPLYAHWTPKTYTVILDRQGATTGSESVTATYGADMPAITPPTMVGYDFCGYYTETDGGGTQYYNADGTSTRPWDIDAATTLYANWEIINFEIDGITYEWTREMNVKVTGYNGASTSITILPSVEHNGVSYNVTEIGEGAFKDNNSLVSIELYPEAGHITIIGARAFKNCTNLFEIVLPVGLTTIEAEAFSGSGLTEITIPEGLTSIGEGAFADCPSLTSVTLPASVTNISDDAFSNCSENLIIYVPDGLVESYQKRWPDYIILPESAKGAVPYIDADGNMAYCTDFTELTGSTEDVTLGSDGVTTWYVVNSDVNYKQIEFCGNINLILCDGKTVTCDGGSASAIVRSSNLTIYGQTAGTGELKAYCASGSGIVSNTLTINGGTVNANGTSYEGNKGISASGDVIINGGNVTAKGHPVGIKAGKNIILGWTNNTDRIYASSFSADGTISIANGKAFTDGTNVYTSATSSDDLKAALNKSVTLIPKKDIAACTATADNPMYHDGYNIGMFYDGTWNSNHGGIKVFDGETELTYYHYDANLDDFVGDYRTSVVSLDYPDDNPCTRVGEHCQLILTGENSWAGTLTIDIEIQPLTGNGTWGDNDELTWNYADGTLNINLSDATGGNKAMKEADNYGKYPWYQYCSHITTISIGEGVTSIADNAFGSQPNIYTYNNVAKVTIPASVTSIGADAFKGCITATDVYCYADPTKLTWGDTGDDFKSGDEKTTCHVADESAWSSFSSVNVTFVGDLAEKSIPYIDADGNMAYCTDFTVIDGNKDRYNDAGWYVVKGNVTKDDGRIDFYGEAHIILADGASLTLSNCSLEGYSHLTIYGQAAGNGTLTATKTDEDGICTSNDGNLTINGGIINATGGDLAIEVGGNLVINGGTVTGTSENNGYGLYAYGTITINGGQVTANGRIYSKGDLAINGGQVTATGWIATEDGNITLGWTNSSDQIKASQILTGYDTNTISIANGKAFTDGTNVYTSATSSATLEALTNVTLRPVTGVTLTDDGEGNLTAEFDGTSLATLTIPNDVTVNAINFGREFTEGVPVTLMLPFSLADGQTFTGGTLYKFSGISKNSGTGNWEATMTQSATLHANTPYLMMPNNDLNSGKVTIGLNSAPVTLNTKTAGESSVTTEASDWEFKGSYEERHWYDGTDGEHAASNAGEIGKVYGFAAYSGKATDGVTDIAAGQFVRFASGAWIRPTRCYLIYNGTGTPGAGARNKRAAAAGELPDKITVRLIGLDGSTTAIGTLDTKTGEMRFDEWYTLDGRRLDGKPTKSGVYINNGKKIVVK